MLKAITILGVVSALLARCNDDAVLAGGAVPPLETVRILPLENGPERLEPSGLTVYKGMVFTLADKVDDTLFRIEFEAGRAVMVEHLKFQPPGRGRMDWEGLTVDADGNFYLASEAMARIAVVDAGSGEARWVSPDLKTVGRQAGLFQKRNAGLEGLVWLGEGHWLAAVEREPRGLIEYRSSHGIEAVSPQLMDKTAFPQALSLLRIPDYSGLTYHNGAVYALFRNGHLVVQLAQTADGYAEVAAWSYAHVETDPQWAYAEQAYGQAEGLAISGERVFIVFDNNRGGRAADGDDRRSLFLEARFPQMTEPK